MVFYFEGRAGARLYMGRDKYENDVLIAHGRPHDVWFHVADLSSAHVYLRLAEGWEIGSIPAEVLEDCCQLTKANSIQGHKEPKVAINYTLHGNLRKGPDMDVGTIGFHRDKDVLTVRHVARDREAVKRLDKTRMERDTESFVQEHRDWLEEGRRAARNANKERKDREAQARKERERDRRKLEEWGSESKGKTAFAGGVDSDSDSEDSGSAAGDADDFM